MPTQDTQHLPLGEATHQQALAQLQDAYGTAALLDAMAAELETWRKTFENDADFQAEVSKDIHVLECASVSVAVSHQTLKLISKADAALLMDIARGGMKRGDDARLIELARRIRGGR